MDINKCPIFKYYKSDHCPLTQKGNVSPYPPGPAEVPPPTYPSEKKLPPYPGGPLNSFNAGPPPPGKKVFCSIPLLSFDKFNSALQKTYVLLHLKYLYHVQFVIDLAVPCESFIFVSATHQPAAPNAPRPSSGPSFPDLPAVPTDLPNLPDSVPGGNSAGGEDVDFDDLTRRFEDLKKKN